MLVHMLSRIGKQIDHKFSSSQRELHRLQTPDQLPRRRTHPRVRKLLTPSELLAKLDRQDKAEAEPCSDLPRTRTVEDFVFRSQSRQDLYRTAPRKGDSAPPAGYYTPSYASVKPSVVTAVWSRTPRKTRTISLDEGSMKLASNRNYPVKPTVSFAKQLPRKSSDPGGDHFLCTGSLTERIPGPDLARTPGRQSQFTLKQSTNPTYHPNFDLIHRPVSRNFSFSKTTGRFDTKRRKKTPVYEHISYRLVERDSPACRFRGRPGSQGSGLPLFMCGLTSWQSVASLNEKTLQLNGAVTDRVSKPESARPTTRASLPGSAGIYRPNSALQQL